MLVYKHYDTKQEKQSIIAEMTDKGFWEVSTEGYFIGEGHLLFDDGKPDIAPAPDLKTEIDDLKGRVKALERK